jgi:hypothetical protein
MMPLETIVIATVISLAFAIFAVVLASADHRTSSTRW